MTALNRRSFVLRVTGGIATSGGALGIVGGEVLAQSPTRSCLTDRDPTDRAQYGTRSGLTDQDTSDVAGRGTLTNRTDEDSTDPAMRGRSWRCTVSGNYTGRTDSDAGASADRSGHGRTGITDSDNGELADRVGYGRGSGGAARITDSDPTDPVGNGRGSSAAGGRTGITDSDAGPGADRAGYGRGNRGGAPHAEPRLPQFPWPPPEPSERTMLPRSRLSQALATEPSLYDVAEHLLDGLNSVGYTEHSFYAVPDGFALVARLERIDDDGTIASEQFRYMPPGEEPFSLSAYVSSLFVAPVGRYRQIVFVVTGQPFVATGARLTERTAGDMLAHGANILPSLYRNLEFTNDHQVSALIYEFEKTGQQPMRQTPRGRMSATLHLRRAGIYAAVVP